MDKKESADLLFTGGQASSLDCGPLMRSFTPPSGQLKDENESLERARTHTCAVGPSTSFVLEM